jgi:hypothetical protein
MTKVRQLHAPAAFTPLKQTRYQRMGAWVGPGAGMHNLMRKIHCPYRESNQIPRSSEMYSPSTDRPIAVSLNITVMLNRRSRGMLVWNGFSWLRISSSGGVWSQRDCPSNRAYQGTLLHDRGALDCLTRTWGQNVSTIKAHLSTPASSSGLQN